MRAGAPGVTVSGEVGEDGEGMSELTVGGADGRERRRG